MRSSQFLEATHERAARLKQPEVHVLYFGQNATYSGRDKKNAEHLTRAFAGAVSDLELVVTRADTAEQVTEAILEGSTPYDLLVVERDSAGAEDVMIAFVLAHEEQRTPPPAILLSADQRTLAGDISTVSVRAPNGYMTREEAKTLAGAVADAYKVQQGN